ncbi:dethiobiotin synthetase BioD [Ameyamaea chiangmaiensis NBRC 103196]|uniref:ATP-dependent dethiobiotin synthetase BioD n=1 Tax=Ameyamaea chiangmaiensis TaxID=442969 RepID=A0A850PB77_9PROT|nr:dethiobiotin synthase [Ameyamaea chiangmaiensis]MBS4073718.1 dethiobiotin synthase [Ameyamaea chiangmaiensis]NVN39790.1 dethiobiotin synthase [Ameyamaea chiangmaiensis]GBQ68708.1 dethiobiotin synthetase BioD [Ameyamaea chiangmaiensis NBRC 103196]
MISGPSSARRSGGVFVTGTDTGVGKSFVSACLVRAWGAAYFKPLQTGLADESGDSETIAGLVPGVHVIPPVYAFDAPLAPDEAAVREGRVIDPRRLVAPDWRGPLVVEGAGGVMVPVCPGVMMADVITRLALPVVLVARSGLGTINHTLLSLEALRTRGAHIAGVVMNGPPAPHNRRAIETHGAVRVLAEIPHVDDISADTVTTTARLIPALADVIG